MVDFLDPPWLIGLAAVAGLVILVLLLRSLFRRPQRAKPQPDELAIDISALDPFGPGNAPPHLEFYGKRVRLAVVVFAPAGRSGAVPPADELLDLYDQIVPNLSDVVCSHQPLVRNWPAQLSSHGFVQAFFNKAQLPGDRGKGTPWCSVAGKVDAVAQPLLVGMVFCGDGPNSLSQMSVQHAGQWLDVLRVRN